MIILKHIHPWHSFFYTSLGLIPPFFQLFENLIKQKAELDIQAPPLPSFSLPRPLFPCKCPFVGLPVSHLLPRTLPTLWSPSGHPQVPLSPSKSRKMSHYYHITSSIFCPAFEALYNLYTFISTQLYIRLPNMGLVAPSMSSSSPWLSSQPTSSVKRVEIKVHSTHALTILNILIFSSSL